MKIHWIWVILIITSVISAGDWFFRKKLLHDLSYNTSFAIGTGFVGVVSIIISIISGLINLKEIKTDLTNIKPWHWVVFAFVPVFVGVARWLVLKGLDSSPVAFFAPTRSLIFMVLIIISGCLLLNEKLSVGTYVGLGVMGIALLILTIQTACTGF